MAKTAFRQFKMKVRSNLAITHTGPETLEEAVQDYVNRNVDLYDAPGMVSVSIREITSLNTEPISINQKNSATSLKMHALSSQSFV